MAYGFSQFDEEDDTQLVGITSIHDLARQRKILTAQSDDNIFSGRIDGYQYLSCDAEEFEELIETLRTRNKSSDMKVTTVYIPVATPKQFPYIFEERYQGFWYPQFAFFIPDHQTGFKYHHRLTLEPSLFLDYSAVISEEDAFFSNYTLARGYVVDFDSDKNILKVTLTRLSHSSNHNDNTISKCLIFAADPKANNQLRLQLYPCNAPEVLQYKWMML
jgi:hypothetical protein